MLKTVRHKLYAVFAVAALVLLLALSGVRPPFAAAPPPVNNDRAAIFAARFYIVFPGGYCVVLPEVVFVIQDRTFLLRFVRRV